MPRSNPYLRVDYDRIAHLYEGQPFRQKEVDANLLAFLAERPREASSLAILDLGCGTGSQLIANKAHIAAARLVGLDLSHGMLLHARRKDAGMLWVQADGARPPFADNSFEFVSNQFSFHHVRDKPGLIASVFRLLRPGGRFVMTNICPREMPGWLYYEFFPAAFERDLLDFLSKEALSELMHRTGFVDVKVELSHNSYDQELDQFGRSVEQREHCSQLIAMADADYRAGLWRLRETLRQHGEGALLKSEICLLAMSGTKPG